jgi:hypothetical protein
MDEYEGARPDGAGNYQRIRVPVYKKSIKMMAIAYVGTEAGRRRFAGNALRSGE